MRRFLSNTSLSAQLIFVTAVGLVLTSGVALVIVSFAVEHLRAAGNGLDEVLRMRLTAALCLAAPVSIGLIMAAVRHLLLRPLHDLRRGMSRVVEGDLEAAPCRAMPNRDWDQVRRTFDRMVARLRDSRAAQDRAEQVLAERTRTVDSLLEFSHTIQGAGLPDQVFQTLSQYLEPQLGLSGVAVLSHHPGALPAIQVRSSRPEGVMRPESPVAEMNGAMCPCLRQNLPKEFRPDASPVRCAIDACLGQPAGGAGCHAAYCIPFNVGRQTQVVVHMLLPPGREWSPERKQLAQTYVNSAVSSLISLHLLAEAEKQSMTDALTGLYNRRSMEQLLQREVALAERHGHPLAVVMVDLDHFKQINDVHGHAAGDHLLKAFADCVRITLRKTDLAFRYGGDEFVIALPQTPLAQAQQVVEKLRQAYAAVDFSHAITRLDRQPTLSIGLTERQAKNNVLTLDNLLAGADQALYDAKTNNRNCVRVYPPTKAA